MTTFSPGKVSSAGLFFNGRNTRPSSSGKTPTTVFLVFKDRYQQSGPDFIS